MIYSCFLLAAVLSNESVTSTPLSMHLMQADRSFEELFERGKRQHEAATTSSSEADQQRSFKAAAETLEAAFKAMSPDRPDYSIYNALGSTYLRTGDLGKAEKYLTAGFQYLNRMDDPTKGKLLSNLGYLRSLLGDTSGAKKYYEQARRYGNAAARRNLNRLNTR